MKNVTIEKELYSKNSPLLTQAQIIKRINISTRKTYKYLELLISNYDNYGSKK